MILSKYCADPGKESRQQTTSDELDLNNSGNNKKHRRVNRGLKWFFLILALILVGGSLYLVLPMINKHAQHSALIRVPQGATIDQVEDSIAKYLGDKFAQDTRRAMIVISGQSEQMRHGAWMIEEGMTPFRAARTLMRGGETSIQITLNDRRTHEDVAELFSEKLEFSKEEFHKALDNAEMLKKYDTDPDHALCIFLKDTYDFFWDATPEDVIKAMRENYRKYWTPERREMADNLRLSPRDLVTLASIVDAETNDPEEKGIIAQLYINRLNQGMKLQSDPTVIYALGDFSIKRVSNQMLQTDSPYNTYMYEGLPPGPIRVTSVQTLDAILNSQPNGYLYMCASDKLDGTHQFAQTYEEHTANAKRYRDELDRRGITF